MALLGSYPFPLKAVLGNSFRTYFPFLLISAQITEFNRLRLFAGNIEFIKITVIAI